MLPTNINILIYNSIKIPLKYRKIINIDFLKLMIFYNKNPG
jgi:hypothetical protein